MSNFKLFRSLIASTLVSLVMVGPVLAAEQPAAADAEALVKKAVAYIKANGAEKAYEEFTNGSGFKDRGLYITVFDLNGKNLAQGANPKLVGKNLIELKDPDGKAVVKMFVDLAKDKGKGWVEGYKFMDPVSQKLERRALYLERVGDTLVGSGITKN